MPFWGKKAKSQITFSHELKRCPTAKYIGKDLSFHLLQYFWGQVSQNLWTMIGLMMTSQKPKFELNLDWNAQVICSDSSWRVPNDWNAQITWWNFFGQLIVFLFDLTMGYLNWLQERLSRALMVCQDKYEAAKMQKKPGAMNDMVSCADQSIQDGIKMLPLLADKLKASLSVRDNSS